MTQPQARTFPTAVKSERGEEPLLGGLVGPPGGGKTASALRIAEGIRRVCKGPVVLVDTEGGRSRKYSPAKGEAADPSRLTFDFLRVDFPAPFRFHDMLACIQQQIAKHKPAVVVVDSLSDCQEGEGGHLDWHDAEVQNVGGNEWAAWAKPAASRRRFVAGVLQIRTPLLFTFRAREKTQQQDDPKRAGKKTIVNIGWMPVAPLEVVHALDFTCILPPRADGVPVWTSEKMGEDFVIKAHEALRGTLQKGQLSEATGEALARWALGGTLPESSSPAAKSPAPSQIDLAGALARGNAALLEMVEPDERSVLLEKVKAALQAAVPATGQLGKQARAQLAERVFGVSSWAEVEKLDPAALSDGLAALTKGGEE